MTVDVAFIGAGWIAGKHFDTLAANDDAEIVAICDVVEASAEEAAERFDAEVFTDHHDLYEEADFDAVFVCLPPFAHEDQELMAAERGIDLFVEKPLALSNEKAREILSAVEANDVIAQAGYNWRYSRTVERAKEILADREVSYLEGYWWGGVAGGEDHWWTSRETSGGQIVEQATHPIDTIRDLGGEVTEIRAQGSQEVVDVIDFSDSVSATLTHETGAVSHVSTSCASEERKVGVEVIADGATLTLHQGIEENRLTGTVDGEEIEETYSEDSYPREVDAFVEAVATDDEYLVRAPYRDSVNTLAVTLGVNESIDTGEAVSLE
ncbi:MAG: Gfo/Idh/MocA family protein [Halobacteriaceae archaeon]